MLILADKESGFNPIENKFNNAETTKLFSTASSTIPGEALARDDRSGKVIIKLISTSLN